MKKYTHKSPEGALIRFEGNRTVTAADDYIKIIEQEDKKKSFKKKSHDTRRKSRANIS